LGLPPEAKTAAEAAEETEDVEEKQEAINEKLLETAMEKDLAADEGYRTEMLAKSQTQFDESDKVFKEGQEANETGDKFDLIAVILTVSLFFGGILQVFRNDTMR